jgi:hypothetical protein
VRRQRVQTLSRLDSIDDDVSGMRWPSAAVGMALGVTDSMPELQGFPAYFTLQFSSLLDYSEKLV